MSSAVWPALPGLTWNVRKNPQFDTVIKRAASGYEVRAANMDYPLWQIDLSYDVLRDDRSVAANGTPTSPYDELRRVIGFFMARQGSYDNFLFNCPEDNTVTDQLFGTGDASETQFQLVRAYGVSQSFSEPVMNINAITNIKKNGVAQSSPADYSVNSAGMVTFTSAPGLGATLTWSGTYYFRCRFIEDMSDVNEFMYDLYEYKKVKMLGSLGSKI